MNETAGGGDPELWGQERARHWDWFAPPARPSADEVGFYELEAGRGPDGTGGAEPRWALLGSTPELRALAGRRGVRLDVVERHAGVYETLGHGLPPRPLESFLPQDWTALEAQEAWGTVLADGSLNMLPGALQDGLITRVHRALRSGGRWLLRVHLSAPARFASLEAVFRNYRERHAREPVFSAVRTDVDMLMMDPATGAVDFQSVLGRLGALHTAGGMTDAEWEAFRRLAPFNRIRLHYRSRESFEASLRGRFHIRAVHVAEDYVLAAQHPLYVLEKMEAR